MVRFSLRTGSVSYTHLKAGSCSTMIAQYFQQTGLPCDEDTASALLYGIKMDTRQFARGVTTLDIEMFKFLNQYCDGHYR